MKTVAAKLSTLALVTVTWLCVSAVSALACGVGGYSYAGLGATTPAFGIGATVTPLGGLHRPRPRGQLGRRRRPAPGRTEAMSGSRWASSVSRN